MTNLTFRQGLVRVQNSGPPNFTPTFLQTSFGGTFIDLNAALEPTVFTFAHFDQNYLYSENRSVSRAWGPFTLSPTQSYWLYWNIDFVTGVLSRGFTRYQPVFGPQPPANPAVDQHWFDTAGPPVGPNSTVIGKVWSGSAWVPVLRVFAAKYENSSTIVPYPLGSQVNINGVNIVAGVPLFDDANYPVQRFSRNRTGVFINTAMQLASQWNRIANFNLETTIRQAEAVEDIAKTYAVAYVGPNRIGLARNTAPQFPAVGIASENMYTGEVRSFTVAGFVENNAWNWDIDNTQPASTPLFVGTTGELVTAPPQTGSIQQIATIVDRQVIYVSVEPIIQYG